MTQATDQVLEQLRTKLRERMNAHADALAQGACKNFPEYTHTTGVIEGLALAEVDLLELDKQITEA